ncbi:MAG: hypothetical protein Q9166_004714 [cf. Caloplaca sp. 2 TL-2023]
MTDTSGVGPALSTPATHIFGEDAHLLTTGVPHLLRSAEQIHIRYEIDRTVAEIRRGRWKRIALQFPDNMLPDAPAVFETLNQRLAESQKPIENDSKTSENAIMDTTEKVDSTTPNYIPEKLYILADTSYGACCVDEIAAEHVNADVVVHYGRACLSPTARLPVIHVFTHQPLAIDQVVESFKSTYLDHDQSIILMSDVTYASHLRRISEKLKAQGYSSIFTTDIVHNPSSPLPNRTVPDLVQLDPMKLNDWQLFHISEPPDSLLLTLSSRVSSIYVFPTSATAGTAAAVTAAVALRRRYALLTSVSTVPILGILINTLSVKNYLHIVEHVKSCINTSGKKNYTFVVGKVNAAKVANFSEVGAWVVIGCWESSLIDSKDFWKPILTPFELELALACDDERVWTGEWKSDFQAILNDAKRHEADPSVEAKFNKEDSMPNGHDYEGFDSEPESNPPEFDLRSGRYVSQSRPMQLRSNIKNFDTRSSGHQQLVRRSKGDITTIGNHASPGAEYLKSDRTWKGLGSDFEIQYDLQEDDNAGAVMEQGRTGSARGYLSAQSNTKT